MAVALNASGTVTVVTGAASPVNNTSLTIAAGSNIALVVQIVRANDSNLFGFALSWDATGTPQSLTKIVSAAPVGSSALVELWGLLNPTTGNKTLRASWTSGTGDIKIEPIAWNGVDQTGIATSFPNSTSATGTSATPSLTITTASGNATMSVVANEGANANAGANQTETFNDTQGSYNAAGARALSSSSSTTHSWSNGGSDAWAEVGTDILASGGAVAAPQKPPSAELPKPWPYPPSQRTATQNLLSSTLIPVVGAPFNLDDWPNPPGPQRALQQTHYRPGPIPVGVPPFNQDDWPNPRGPEYPIGLRVLANGFLPKQPPVTAVPPPSQHDWPNPRGAVSAIALLTWTASPTVQQPPPGPLNASPSSLPRQPIYPPDNRTFALNLLENTLFIPVPFNQEDWPNPRGADYSIILRILSASPMPPALAAGQPVNQDDWPNPRGVDFPIVLRTLIGGFLPNQPPPVIGPPPGNQVFDRFVAPPGSVPSVSHGTRAAGPGSPFKQDVWALPRGPDYPVSLRTLTGQLLPNAPQPQLPFGPSDWPNPRGSLFPLSLLTGIVSPQVPPQPFPAKQTDWPLPRGAEHPIILRTLASGFLPIPPPPAPPFSQDDWPNPRGSIPGISLLSWNQGPQPQQQPIPFNQDDWPNPRGSASAIDLLTWQAKAIPGSDAQAVLTNFLLQLFVGAISPPPGGALVVLRGVPLVFSGGIFGFWRPVNVTEVPSWIEVKDSSAEVWVEVPGNTTTTWVQK